MIIGASRRLDSHGSFQLNSNYISIIAKSYLSDFNSGMALLGSIKHPKHSRLAGHDVGFSHAQTLLHFRCGCSCRSRSHSVADVRAPE